MNPEFKQHSVSELLEVTYKKYGIPEGGGQHVDQVKIEFTPSIFVFIPNFKARKAIVMKHDAHHLITSTPFTLLGETEIAMWEIAAGCYRNWFAFLINSTAIPLGLFVNLPKVFNAFVIGRRSRSLYDNRYSDETFLNMNAAELYEDVGLNRFETVPPKGLSDYILFSLWIIVCAFINLLVLVILPFLFLYNIYVFAIVLPRGKELKIRN